MQKIRRFSCIFWSTVIWTPGEMSAFLEATADHHHGTLFRVAAMRDSAVANCADSDGPTSTSRPEPWPCDAPLRRPPPASWWVT